MQTFKSSTNAYQHKYALFIFNPMMKLMAHHLGWGFFFSIPSSLKFVTGRKLPFFTKILLLVDTKTNK